MIQTPFAAMTAATLAWQRAALAQTRMMMQANEVIWRRSIQMALGTMTAQEATRMVLEKPAAFMAAMERAATAAAGSRGHAEATLAALRPIGARTGANVRRLRRTRR